MKRILFAWELGANYGHIERQLPIARGLSSAGAEVRFAASDPAIARTVLAHDQFDVLAAPCWRDRRSTAYPDLNYSTILSNGGYRDSESLIPVLRAWISLLTCVRPTVIVVDHAPTATLAGSALGIPTVSLGSGFCIPPAAQPFPSLDPWRHVEERELIKADERLLNVVNESMHAVGVAGFDSLVSAFCRRPALATTFGELDPYGARTDVEYVGPISVKRSRRIEHWKHNVHRIVVYLRRNTPGRDELLRALRSIDAEVVAILPGHLAPSAIDERARFRVHGEALELSELLPTTNAVISNAGAGLICESLIQGVPLVMVPTTLEQTLNARRVTELGAGIHVRRRFGREVLRRQLVKLLEEPIYCAAAKNFALARVGYDISAAVHHAARSIANLA